MSTYLYAVVPADTTLPEDLVGLGEERVAAVGHGDLAAVVGQVDADRSLGRRADIVAHGNVLDALVRSGGPVVPVRFGAVFEDDAQVVEAVLEPQADHLRQVLEGLRDRSQLTLRARYDEELVLTEVVQENPDIAALREATRDGHEDATYPERVQLGELVAQALEHKRDADGQLVLDALVPRAVASSVRPGSGLDHLLEVAFLVDNDLVGEFEDAAEALAASMAPRATLALVGPVAPHDFVPRDE